MPQPSPNSPLLDLHDPLNEPDHNVVATLIRPATTRARLLDALERLGARLPHLTLVELLALIAADGRSNDDEHLLIAALRLLDSPDLALER